MELCLLSQLRRLGGALLLLAWWLGVPDAANAQALKNVDVEGLVFIKEHSFTDSGSGAWPIEYRSLAANAQIIIISTREGQRLRLRIGQVPDIIPYPGRGGVSQAEALVLCDLALEHYPQYRTLLTNIRNGWRKVTADDFAKYGKASEARKKQMDGLMAYMEAESSRISSLRVSGAWVPSTTLLDGKPAAQSTPHSVPVQASDSGPANQPTEPETEEMRDLQRQLEKLQAQ